MFVSTQDYIWAVKIDREIEVQKLTRVREARRLEAETEPQSRRRWHWLPSRRSARVFRAASFRGA
jgi:hypothetical protein